MKRLLLLFAGVALTVAQAQQPKPASVTESHAAESHAAGSQAAWSDAAWMKHYAVACAPAAPLLAPSYYGDRPIGIFSKAFLQSLNAWHTSSLDPQKILLVTVVWPNGRSHDHA
jgi:hypothetical protein